MWTYGVFLLFLLWYPLAFANHSTLRVDPFNTNPINSSGQPSSSFGTQLRESLEHEIPQFSGRHSPLFVYSGGFHGTATGLTSVTFATEAFLPERVSQVATAITYAAIANDVCWTIISSDNNGITGWTRVGTTAYYYLCEGDTTPTQPTLPPNSAWLMLITVTNGAIAAVEEIATVVVTSAVTISVSRTVGTRATWLFLLGGQLTLNAGVTLTMNGRFRCPAEQQCLTGTGLIVFGVNSAVEVYPQWWGATQAGSNRVAIEAAIIASPAGQVIRLSIDSTLDRSVAVSRQVILNGDGHCLRAETPFAATIADEGNLHRMILYVTASRVEIQNVCLDGNGLTDALTGVWVANGAEFVAIRNSRLTALRYDGIAISTGVLFRPTATNGRFEGNRIDGNTSSAATAQGGSNMVFDNNVYIGPTTGAAFDTTFGLDGGTNGQITNNRILLSTAAAPIPGAGSILGVTSGASQFLIAHNVIRGLRSGVGIYAWDGAVAAVGRGIIAHNIVDGAGVVASGATTCIRVQKNASDLIVVEGNECVNAASGSSSYYIDVGGAYLVRVLNNTLRSTPNSSHIAAIAIQAGGGEVEIGLNTIDTSSRCIYLVDATDNGGSRATVRFNRCKDSSQFLNWTGAVNFPVHMQDNRTTGTIVNPLVGTKWDRPALNAGMLGFPHVLRSDGASMFYGDEVPSSPNYDGFTFYAGEHIIRANPVVGFPTGWRCTVTGSFPGGAPPTFVALPNL